MKHNEKNELIHSTGTCTVVTRKKILTPFFVYYIVNDRVGKNS